MKKDSSSRLNLSSDIAIPKAQLSKSTVLGEGGFGTVYSGTWRPTALFKKSVAVKELKVTKFSKQTLKEFEAEVTVHAKLESPSIVQLYGVTFEQPYSLVMALMQNGSLDNYLQNYTIDEISWDTRIQLTCDIAVGLDYLHSQQPPIIHADLKSLNILLDKRYRAKLADFGLATIKEETASLTQSSTKFTESGKVQGSLLWMSPELFKRRAQPTKVSDVYAFGMVMWEISTHKYPFAQDARKGMDLIKDYIKDGDVDPFPKHAPEQYAKLGDVCRALSPGERPSTAKVLQALGVSEGTKTSEIKKEKMSKSSSKLQNIPYDLETKPIDSSVKLNIPYDIETKPVESVVKSSPKVSERGEVNALRAEIERMKLAQAQEREALKVSEEKARLQSELAQLRQGEQERERASQKALLARRAQAQVQKMTPGQRVDLQAQKTKGDVDRGKVSTLLNHVVRGDLDNVKKLLSSNKALVYAQGDITDSSERKFPKITAFQYALWALDKPMWELIVGFLPTEHAAFQCKALEDDRKDISRAHGKHFSFDIVSKLQHYIDHYDGWERGQRKDYWCKEVGGAQLAFPAWLILMMCEKGKDVAWTKQDVNRSVTRDVSHLKWWFTHEYNDGLLGNKFGFVRASRTGGHLGMGDAFVWGRGHDHKFSAILKSTRSRELAELKVQLYPNDSELANTGKGLGY